MKKLCGLGLVHGDLHWDNVGFQDGKMMLIDFGWSSNMPCKKEFEYFQLYRTLGLIPINNSNRNYLQQKLRKILNDLNVEISGNINEQYLNIHEKYAKKFYEQL